MIYTYCILGMFTNIICNYKDYENFSCNCEKGCKKLPGKKIPNIRNLITDSINSTYEIVI